MKFAPLILALLICQVALGQTKTSKGFFSDVKLSLGYSYLFGEIKHDVAEKIESQSLQILQQQNSGAVNEFQIAKEYPYVNRDIGFLNESRSPIFPDRLFKSYYIEISKPVLHFDSFQTIDLHLHFGAQQAIAGVGQTTFGYTIQNSNKQDSFRVRLRDSRNQSTLDTTVLIDQFRYIKVDFPLRFYSLGASFTSNVAGSKSSVFNLNIGIGFHYLIAQKTTLSYESSFPDPYFISEDFMSQPRAENYSVIGETYLGDEDGTEKTIISTTTFSGFTLLLRLQPEFRLGKSPIKLGYRVQYNISDVELDERIYFSNIEQGILLIYSPN